MNIAADHRRTTSRPSLALAAEDEAVLHGRPSRLGTNDVRGWLARVDLAQDSWLYEEDGKLVAVSWFDFIDDLGFFVGIVAQGAKGRGLGTRIVETGEARARERGAARVQTFGLEEDTAAAALFERPRVSRRCAASTRWRSSSRRRRSCRRCPKDSRSRRFRMEDARPFYEALDAAFQDHWEHHTVGFEQLVGGEAERARLRSDALVPHPRRRRGRRGDPQRAGSKRRRVRRRDRRAASRGAARASGARCSCERSRSSTRAACRA